MLLKVVGANLTGHHRLGVLRAQLQEPVDTV